MNARSLLQIVKLSYLAVSTKQTNVARQATFSYCQQRNYWRPKKARAPYTKELDFSYSGDASDHVVKVDTKIPRPGFKTLLKDYESDEVIQKLFSMEYGNHCELLQHMIEEVVKMVQDHPLDVKSLEVEIAKNTVLIRNQIKHCLRFRHDNFSIVVLKNRITRRNDALGELLTFDKEKYDWLVGKLGLKYTPPKKYKDLSRRATRKKVARDTTIALIKKKNEELKEKLDAERVDFEKVKVAELKRIVTRMREMGLGEVNSVEEALKALGHEEMIPKKEVIPSRAQLILKKKMEAFMPGKKVADDKKLKENGFLTPTEMPAVPDKLFY